MTSVAVLIPVLDRPQRVRPLVASLVESSRYIETLALFLVSPGDDAELAEIEAVRSELTPDDPDVFEPVFPLVVDWQAGPGDYAKKINYGAEWAIQKSSYEWVFLAADDLVFHPGWIERALAAHLESHACVVGTNDLGNGKVIAGDHSTHTLVHRDYLECGTADEAGILLHEGYDHNFCDTELVETAMWRETWEHATDSVVEHLHPFWGKAEKDATYEKGQARSNEDQQLFQTRRRLWS